jgi:hypothetical protein
MYKFALLIKKNKQWVAGISYYPPCHASHLSAMVQCFSLTTNQRTVLFSLTFQRNERDRIGSGYVGTTDTYIMLQLYKLLLVHLRRNFGRTAKTPGLSSSNRYLQAEGCQSYLLVYDVELYWLHRMLPVLNKETPNGNRQWSLPFAMVTHPCVKYK